MQKEETRNDGLPNAVEDFDNWDGAGDYTDTDEGGRDLVENKEQWNIACYGDAEDLASASYTEINGWTTGEDNYIKIYTPVTANEVGTNQRHQGRWDDSAYRLVVNDTTYIGIRNHAKFIHIDGLQIKLIYTGGSAQYGLLNSVTDSSSNVRISNNIILAQIGSAAGNAMGIASSGGNSKIWNNIVIAFINGTGEGRGISTAGTSYVYNNTILKAKQGLNSCGVATVTARNNLIQDCYSECIYSGCGYTADSGNNIVEDSYGSGAASDKLNTEIDFFDKQNGDYHLSPEDTAALDAGTSSVSDIVTTDIDGQPIHTYDIGADDGSQYFVSSIKYLGADAEFSSLATWESANEVDLTATNTLVFNISSASGTMPYHSSVIGETSGAVASTTVVATTSMQVLMYNIASSTFIAGERVYLQGQSPDTIYYILDTNSAGNPAIAVAKIDGAWAGADTNQVIFDGWATAKYNYIKVYTTDTARHQGVWNENKYRLNPTLQPTILIKEQAVEISGLQVTNTRNRDVISGGSYSAENLQYNIHDNIIKSQNTEANNGNTCINFTNAGSSADSGIIKIWNNIVYDTYVGIGVEVSNVQANIYNNTVYNIAKGTSFYYSDFYVYNNLIQNTSSYCYNASNYIVDSANNISDDSTALGTNSKTNTTVNFLDADNDDFRLATEDTAARDAGTNLSADVNLHFTDDAQGNERYDAKWDIGALEGPTILYRSVGNDTNNLAGAGNTVTIATTTAAFDAVLPDNVGVGDVLQYGSSGYYQLAFITARASSTQYEVQARDGTLPTATTTAPVSVFRAHEFLENWEAQTAAKVNDGIDDTVNDLVLYPKASLDLTASNTAMFVPCYASTSPDNIYTNISDWITATTSNIKIYTPVASSEVGISQRHNGWWDSSKYRLEISNTDGIQLEIANVNLTGLQIGLAITGANRGDGIIFYNSDAKFNSVVSHNIIKSNSPTSEYNHGIIGYIGADGSTVYVYDNVVSDFGTSSSLEEIGIYANVNFIFYIYNNTVYNVSTGIYSVDESVAINNAIFNSSVSDFNGTFDSLDHNASDDLDGDNPIDISPGGSEADGWNAAFTSIMPMGISGSGIWALSLYDVGHDYTLP